MPKGGRRIGAGRPTKEAAAAKAALLAETIKRGPKVAPRAYLQGLLDSPGSSKSEKLRAAELLLKLTRGSDSNVGSQASAISATPLCIYSVPRGSRIDVKSGAIIFPEGVEPELIEPFKPTADWTRTPLANRRDQRAETECEPFEVTEAEVPANLVRMDTFKNKRDDEGDQGPAGAA